MKCNGTIYVSYICWTKMEVILLKISTCWWFIKNLTKMIFRKWLSSVTSINASPCKFSLSVTFQLCVKKSATVTHEEFLPVEANFSFKRTYSSKFLAHCPMHQWNWLLRKSWNRNFRLVEVQLDTGTLRLTWLLHTCVITEILIWLIPIFSNANQTLIT